jgi:ribonucleoside-diphosphate reductase subunit M2
MGTLKTKYERIDGYLVSFEREGNYYQYEDAPVLAAFSLDSPIRPLKLIDDEKLPESPASLTDAPEANHPLDIPRKYVGDVDLPESEEPLLKESRRRFVLFPIQYHEVCDLFWVY